MVELSSVCNWLALFSVFGVFLFLWVAETCVKRLSADEEIRDSMSLGIGDLGVWRMFAFHWKARWLLVHLAGVAEYAVYRRLLMISYYGAVVMFAVLAACFFVALAAV